MLSMFSMHLEDVPESTVEIAFTACNERVPSSSIVPFYAMIVS